MKQVMITIENFRKVALSFPEAVELPHFESTSFRVKKKIFATYSEKTNRACLKFTEIDQSAFCSFDQSVIFPVPDKWGKQGWTFIDLAKVKEETLTDALTTAYCTIASKGLAKGYLPNE